MNRYYVEINGVSSLTIPGLAISELPPISKPLMRNSKETIDGRDGDIITELGYSAYDKTIKIGLYGSYDIDQIIAFFNQKGTIVFSDENDKYYNFTILEKIDYAKLVKFRTASVKFHCQPFKYKLNEEPEEAEAEFITAEGTQLTLNNTTDEALEITLKGNTYQYTTTGKNLLPNLIKTGRTSSGVTFTYNEDGTYTLNGQNDDIANSSVYLIQNGSFTLPAGTYYTISPTGGVALIGYGNSRYITFFSKTVSSFTLDAETTFTSVYLQVAKGQTINFNNYVVYPIISTNAITETDYEPYTNGASPNPDYPQEVQVVTGNNNINICSENLFDKENSTLISRTVGTNTRWGYKLPKMANDFYVSRQASDSAGFRIFEDINGEMVGAITSSLSTTPVLVTNTNNDFYLLCTSTSIKATAEDNFNNNNFMISYKNITYKPYQGQNYPINLGTLELCKIGDYQDYLYKSGENWYKKAYIGKVVLDGTENWGSYTDLGTNARAYFTKNGIAVRSAGYCSHFNVITTQTWAVDATGIMFTPISSSLIALKIPKSELATQDITGVKNWLSTNNVTAYYLYDTPADIQITNAELIGQLNNLYYAYAYKDQTNINQENADMPFILNVSTIEQGSNELVVTNEGNIYAKPTINVKGTGTIQVFLNESQVFSIDMSTYNDITIDTALMEAYDNNGLRNRQITGNYENFKLQPGENTLRFSGKFQSATIINYTRWL